MSIVGDHIAIITLFHSASTFGMLLMTMILVVFTCITLPVHLVHSGCCWCGWICWCWWRLWLLWK